MPGGNSHQRAMQKASNKPISDSNPTKVLDSGRFRKAVYWIGARLWAWPVILLAFAIISGAGISAMYANAYIAAAVLYFISIVLLISKCLLAEETSKHEQRGLVSFLILIIAALVFGASLVWNEYVHADLQRHIATSLPAAAKPESQEERDAKLEANVKAWLSELGDVKKNDDPTCPCYFSFDFINFGKRGMTVVREKNRSQILEVATRQWFPQDVVSKIKRLSRQKQNELENQIRIDLLTARMEYKISWPDWILLQQNLTIDSNLDSDKLMKAVAGVDAEMVKIRARTAGVLNLQK